MYTSKISFIVPVYNGEKYIGKCVNSILAQSYEKWELILVDDGSEDKTKSICLEYQKKDKRIHYFYKDNGGVSSARNIGIENARGDFICFVDSDDFIDNDFCMLMLDAVHSGICMVALGLKRYTENDETRLIHHRIQEGYYEVSDLLKILVDDGTLSGFTFHSSCSVLFDTKIIRNNKLKFNTELKYNEDGLFTTEYLLLCNKGDVYINFQLAPYYYRVNKRSASHNIDINTYLENMRIIENQLKLYDINNAIVDQLLKRRATIALDLLVIFLKGHILSYNIVKNILGSEKVVDAYKIIDIKHLSVNKRIWVILVRLKQYLLIYIILKIILIYSYRT